MFDLLHALGKMPVVADHFRLTEEELVQLRFYRRELKNRLCVGGLRPPDHRLMGLKQVCDKVSELCRFGLLFQLRRKTGELAQNVETGRVEPVLLLPKGKFPLGDAPL